MKYSAIDDERRNVSSDPPAARNGVKDVTSQSQVYQRRIDHVTTATITNDRYTTIRTLETRSTKDDSTIATHVTHHRIFDAIKAVDDTTTILSLDRTRIRHGKDIPEGDDYKKVLKDWRVCDVAKRVCVSFKLESTQTLFKLKY